MYPDDLIPHMRQKCSGVSLPVRHQKAEVFWSSGAFSSAPHREECSAVTHSHVSVDMCRRVLGAARTHTHTQGLQAEGDADQTSAWMVSQIQIRILLISSDLSSEALQSSPLHTQTSPLSSALSNHCRILNFTYHPPPHYLCRSPPKAIHAIHSDLNTYDIILPNYSLMKLISVGGAWLCGHFCPLGGNWHVLVVISFVCVCYLIRL